MKTKNFFLVAMLAIALIASSCQQNSGSKKQGDKQTIIPAEKTLNAKSQKYVDERLGIYAPFELTADLSRLSENEVEIVKILH